MEADFTCPRCSGKGGLNCFAHVRQGICFECWGTKQSFKLQERHLQGWVARLRGEFRTARRNGLPTGAIVERGLKARKALDAFLAFAHSHVESCKAQYPG